MLEIHAPHEAVHTWKDFLIHIATIVIGLLIAIGLEQTVEYFHHREQAKHARETLAQEMAINRESVKQNLYSLRLNQEYLFADLPVIQRARMHKLAAGDLIVVWHPRNALADTSWQTLHESGAASLLPYLELRRYARIYAAQKLFGDEDLASSTALLNAQSMFYRSAADRFVYKQADRTVEIGDSFGANGDAAARKVFENQAPGAARISSLTPAQLDRLEQAIQEGIYADDRLINLCLTLQGRYEQLAQEGK